MGSSWEVKTGWRVKKWKERDLEEKEVKCMVNGWSLSEGCLRNGGDSQELAAWVPGPWLASSTCPLLSFTCRR